jgi:hypothetical protein
MSKILVLIMSEEEKDDFPEEEKDNFPEDEKEDFPEDEKAEVTEKEKEDEKKFLKTLGVSSTWDILTSKDKKKKEPEKKPEFRGFK